MHQPSGTYTRQKIHTTLTKYKTMQQDGSIMTTHTTQVSLPYKKTTELASSFGPTSTK